MSDVYFGNSIDENEHLKYQVPPTRVGEVRGSVLSRELGGYVHDPEAVMARIQAEIDKNAERATKVTKEKTGHIAVADTIVLAPNAAEYLDEAPLLPPAKINKYSSF